MAKIKQIKAKIKKIKTEKVKETSETIVAHKLSMEDIKKFKVLPRASGASEAAPGHKGTDGRGTKRSLLS